MESPIIPPVDKELIKAELTPERQLRMTNKSNNAIYIITAHNAPNTMREIGRLREEAFRAAGGGTGKEIDIDEFDTCENCYKQLIVWNPDAEEIIGGYRYLEGENWDLDSNGQPILATSHMFHFSEKFIKEYKEGKFTLQPLNTVQATVTLEDGSVQLHKSLNEIVIKGVHSHSVHLDISIGDSPIEKFSGDGILVATSAGSTAYNYSLGGSIVDPRLKLLQVTPIAPMNTTAYRSLTSSILLPAELSIGVVPEENETHKNNRLTLLNDGDQNIYMNVKEIKIEFSESVINLVRFEAYDFWSKVKNKFL
jgi:hypothetical protein